VGPEGPQGPQGEEGPEGPQGPAGPVAGANHIINGDMGRNERNVTGFQTTINVYTVDRWRFESTDATVRGNWGRIIPLGGAGSDIPFKYALNYQCTFPAAPLGLQRTCFTQILEAEEIVGFGWGTANAKPVTLSFHVSVQAGVPDGSILGGSVQNYAMTRSCPFQWVKASGWQKVEVTIPGDMAIVPWSPVGNAPALRVNIGLGAGVNLIAPAGGWTDGQAFGPTGVFNIVSVSGGLMVTGVKLEVGDVATPFQFESLAKRVADCERYYQRLNFLTLSGYPGSTAVPLYGSHTFHTAMRATPTTTLSNIVYGNASGLAVVAGQIDNGALTLTMTPVANQYGRAHFTVTLDAELV
jgi:hypothetical protein